MRHGLHRHAPHVREEARGDAVIRGTETWHLRSAWRQEPHGGPSACRRLRCCHRFSEHFQQGTHTAHFQTLAWGPLPGVPVTEQLVTGQFPGGLWRTWVMRKETGASYDGACKAIGFSQTCDH